MFDANIELTGFIMPLIKYIHSNCVMQKLRKAKFEHNEREFIMHLNHFVLEEKQILNTLISNGNMPIESALSTYINRLIQSRLLYEIPNSEQSLHERELKKARERCEKEGGILMAMWQSPTSSPRLFALTFDAYEILKYLKDNKLIFQEFDTEEQQNER